MNGPFPALTPAQRYHFEIHGYVVVPGVLSRKECRTIMDAMQRTKQAIRARPEEYTPGPGEPSFIIDLPHHVFMGAIREADPVFAAYAAHPRLAGMAEEVIGGEARIVELNAQINSRNSKEKFTKEPKFGFHLGIDVLYGTHVKNSLLHCSFVKTLTNLTDLGPDDGGTVVVAGSHKLDLPEADIIACAYADRSLIHQVIAPAGSTLLFAETLIHATGQIRSDRERGIIVCGYGTRMFPWWDGGDMTPAFRKKSRRTWRRFFAAKPTGSGRRATARSPSPRTRGSSRSPMPGTRRRIKTAGGGP